MRAEIRQMDSKIMKVGAHQGGCEIRDAEMQTSWGFSQLFPVYMILEYIYIYRDIYTHRFLFIYMCIYIYLRVSK